MKKILYNLLGLFAAVALLSSCEAEEGRNPGSDGAPSVKLFKAVTAVPNDPDEDATVRFATNNATEKVYFLVEKKADADKFVKENGEGAYAQHILKDGNVVDGVTGACNVDRVVKQLHGEYLLSAVAVRGNQQSAVSQIGFVGYTWSDVVKGTYSIRKSMSSFLGGLSDVPTVLQVRDDNPSLYRFKDLFGA